MISFATDKNPVLDLRDLAEIAPYFGYGGSLHVATFSVKTSARDQQFSSSQQAAP
jgi:hypothetical protein